MNHVRKIWRRLKLGFHGTVSAVVIIAALVFLIYPAVTICAVVFDSQLKKTGESRLVPIWFESAAGRYLSWANTYLNTDYAKSLYHDNIAATEWPIFGSVFYLVTAEDLQARGKIDAAQGTIHRAVERAAQIVASPITGTWVGAGAKRAVVSGVHWATPLFFVSLLQERAYLVRFLPRLLPAAPLLGHNSPSVVFRSSFQRLVASVRNWGINPVDDHGADFRFPA